MKTIAILHTKKESIEALDKAICTHYEDVRLINILDDSLQNLVERVSDIKNENNDKDTIKLYTRLLSYAKNASEEGADLILLACSLDEHLLCSLQEKIAIDLVCIDKTAAKVIACKFDEIRILGTQSGALYPIASHILALNPHIKISMCVDKDAKKAQDNDDYALRDKYIVQSIQAQMDKPTVIPEVSLSKVATLLNKSGLESVIDCTTLCIAELKNYCDLKVKS